MKTIDPIRRTPRTRPQGFSLVELLAVVALLGSFSLLASEAFVTITSITRDSNRSQTTSHRLDAVIRILRADVWQAASIQTPDDATAELELPAGRGVTWHITRDGTISRRAAARSGDGPAEVNTWEKFNVPLRFAARDGTLRVASTPQDHSLSDELVLVSQMNLAIRRQP